jgi:hypothetical protein
VTVFGEYVNESFDFITDAGLLEQLSGCKLLKKDSTFLCWLLSYQSSEYKAMCRNKKFPDKFTRLVCLFS